MLGQTSNQAILTKGICLCDAIKNTHCIILYHSGHQMTGFIMGKSV